MAHKYKRIESVSEIIGQSVKDIKISKKKKEVVIELDSYKLFLGRIEYLKLTS